MEFFLMYLAVSIEKIAGFLSNGFVVAIIGAAIYLAVLFGSSMESCDGKESTAEIMKHPIQKSFVRVGKAFVILGLIAGCIGSVLPTKEELAYIIGGGVTYNVVTSDTAKRLGTKFLDAVESKLDAMDTPKPVEPEKPKPVPDPAPLPKPDPVQAVVSGQAT
ncbi:hypothetical protein [Pseudomonas phage Astolliot]|nr:hypothetical protein [Pseudomonas phage Astolliot]